MSRAHRAERKIPPSFYLHAFPSSPPGLTTCMPSLPACLASPLPLLTCTPAPLPLLPPACPPLSLLPTCQLVVLSAAQQKKNQIRMGDEDKAGVIPEDRGEGGHSCGPGGQSDESTLLLPFLVRCHHLSRSGRRKYTPLAAQTGLM